MRKRERKISFEREKEKSCVVCECVLDRMCVCVNVYECVHMKETEGELQPGRVCVNSR